MNYREFNQLITGPIENWLNYIKNFDKDLYHNYNHDMQVVYHDCKTFVNYRNPDEEAYIHMMIATNGVFPCCYITLPVGHLLHGLPSGNLSVQRTFAVHGGVTYADSVANTQFITDNIREKLDPADWVVGWDYAHTDDYNAFKKYHPGDTPPHIYNKTDLLADLNYVRIQLEHRFDEQYFCNRALLKQAATVTVPSPAALPIDFDFEEATPF